METTHATPAPAPLRDPDVVVTTGQRYVKFEPRTLRAQAWLARNIGPEHHSDGHVVMSPLRATHMALCMATDGLVLR